MSDYVSFEDLDEFPTYALTIHWPWATAITHGDKRVENRTWRPWDRIIGERIAIHVGKAEDTSADRQMRGHPDIDFTADQGPHFADAAGQIIGIARVLGYIDVSGDVTKEHMDLPGERTAHSEALTAYHQSPWFGGPVGWLLDDVQVLGKWTACRGAQGLWKVKKQLGKTKYSAENQPTLFEEGQ